ncbi:MAG: hemerythrin domain-containing protein [Polyangiaceae bacterium]|nr:hemerythrin domain-containing protein [Polyangiaceae bacterium]
MNTTEWLKRDHELILDALDVLAITAKWAQAGGVVPEQHMRKLIAFFREFADDYHHQKEEQVLFPALLAAGMPRQGPVAVMLREHDMGRDLLRRIEVSLPELDVEAALDYVDLLSLHIRKENEILFYMADRLLEGCDQQLLAQMLTKTENAVPQIFGQDDYRRNFAEIQQACSE